jgi:hypothetical protein
MHKSPRTICRQETGSHSNASMRWLRTAHEMPLICGTVVCDFQGCGSPSGTGAVAADAGGSSLSDGTASNKGSRSADQTQGMCHKVAMNGLRRAAHVWALCAGRT